MTRVLMTADAVGGVWTYALTLARGLVAHDVQVTLATMGPPPTRDQVIDASAIPGLVLETSDFALEWQFRGTNPPWDDVYAAGSWLLELAARVAPDIVHLNGYAHAALPFGAPTIVVGHSCLTSWCEATRSELPALALASYGRIVRAGLRAADWVVAPTFAMLAALERCHGRLARATVIPNGRDPVERCGREKQPLVASGGRVWDRAKNVSALRSIAPDLAWPVAIAGPATIDAAPVPHAKMLDLLAGASIFALPARYEPFGLLPLEAAMSGCALVLGDIASLREVWSDAAIYVDPDDACALRSAIDALIADPEYRGARAAAASARAARYTAAAMARRYAQLYRTVEELRRCA
jgi:glycogen synthase